MAIKRRSNLPKSRVQLKVVMVFLGIGLISLVAQYIFSLYAVRDLLQPYPRFGAEFDRKLTSDLFMQLLTAACLLVPLTLSLGILVTFRIVGPAKRMEDYLNAVAMGDQIGPCRIRDGDELGDLCDALNRAVSRLRADAAAAQSPAAAAAPPIAEAQEAQPGT